MTTIKTVLTSLLVAAFATPAFAFNFYNPFLIPSGKVTVEEIGRGQITPTIKAQLFSVENDCSNQNRNSGQPLNSDGGVVWDDGVSGTILTGDPQLDIIVNMGKKVWNLIQANAPVVNLKLATANALPQGIQCWTQLEKWQAIRSIDYKITVKSIVNLDVVVYVARVIYAYGGSYKGKGRYIANAAVQNKEVIVKMTNVVDVDVEIANVLNGGTEQDPVAVMQLNISFESKKQIFAA